MMEVSPGDSLYVKTCETLCRHFRLEMFRTGDSREDWDEILRNSGLRYTATILEGQWWKSAHGAFLGEFDDGSPVAVLPARFWGHSIYNPADGSIMPVNAGNAARLQPAAYTIYRTFPAGSVGIGACLRLILAGHTGTDILLIMLFGFLSSLTGALPPVITAQIFDDFIPGALTGMIAQAVVILLCFDLAQILFQVITNIGVSRIKAKTGLALEAAVLDRILSQNMTFFEERTAGETLSKIDAVNRLRSLVSPDAAKDMLQGLFFFVSVVVMFRLHAGAARWALLIVLAFIAVCAVLLSRCFALYGELLAKETESETVNLQMTQNARRIHDAGAESRAFQVWHDTEESRRRAARELKSRENALSAFIKAFTLAGPAGMFLAVAASGMSASLFVAFSGAFMSVMYSLMALVRAMMKAPEFSAVCASLRPALAQPEKHGKLCPHTLKAKVEARGLSFFYGDFGENIVDNLSFSLHEGETLGIYGGTGSGKTTLVKLLLGLYKPKAGKILTGGYENGTLDPVYGRRQWGVITQETGLTSVSLYRFLSGNSGGTEEAVYDALAAVKMADQVRELGLQTRVEDCGFSRGAMERLMAARVILGRRRLVIFDDPSDETAFGAVCALDAAKIIMTGSRTFLDHCDTVIRNTTRISVNF
ncbi:MAG: ABC transporter ATP-binding protein/permease [Treponema sp.]|jgi:ABC-type bacteriocin/lantibiotic exporter with double-glycine peptidase domain|nr:ABC transporter ATP-binding protein/permease [Treponema sp.]